MSVTIASFTFDYSRGTSGYLRSYADEPFVDPDGVEHPTQPAGGRDYMEEVAFTAADNLATVPTFTHPATWDEASGSRSSVTVYILDANRNKVGILVANFRIPTLPSTTTWGALRTYNDNAATIRDTDTYTKTQTNYQIEQYLQVGNPATTSTIGRGAASVAPLDPAFPVFVEENDPLVFNVRTYGALGAGSVKHTGSISAASQTLTVTGANFTEAMEGQLIAVYGANTSGRTLLTTISDYISATQVTLAVPAVTTVANAKVVWGRDEKADIDEAFDAVNAAGGGRVYFPPGVYVHSGGAYVSTYTFNREGSNLVIEGLGEATQLYFLVEGVGMRLGIPYAGFSRGGSPPWGYPTPYRFNAANIGATSVTMTTAAHAANFAPNDVVWLQSGDGGPLTGHPPQHFEYNEVLSSNAGTGVVVFKYQLSDSYDAGEASYEPYMAVMQSTPTNIEIRGLRIENPIYGGVVLVANGTRNVRVHHCHILGVTYNGYSQGFTLDHNDIESPDPINQNLFELGDAGYETTISYNRVHGSSYDAIGGSGSIRRYRISHNRVENYARNTALYGFGINIVGSDNLSNYYPAREVHITDNEVVWSTTPDGAAAINVARIEDSSVERNTITGRPNGNASAGIIVDDGAKRVRVRGNTIRFTSAGSGISVVPETGTSGGISQCDISGNIIDVPGNGLTFNGAGTLTNCTISNNQIDGVAGVALGPLGGAPGTYTGNRIFGNSQGNSGSATWNPGSLADGASESKDVTVTGVSVGDVVTGVGFSSITAAGWDISAQVRAANTVTVLITNRTGGTVDLPSGTVTVEVLRSK